MRVPVAIVAIAIVVATAGAATPEETLRAADVATLVPSSFRARFRVLARGAASGDAAPLDVEVWRDGPDRSLVRRLDTASQGAVTLRIGTSVWLASPRTKRPVKIGAALRLRGGAALDFLTSMAYSRDYEVAGATLEASGATTLDLRRRAGVSAAHPPRVLYSVASGRPVRIETFLPGGKRSATLDLAGWPEEAGGLPSAVTLIDHLHGESTTEVALVELEIRDVPAGLFDLDDGSERARLPAGTAHR